MNSKPYLFSSARLLAVLLTGVVVLAHQPPAGAGSTSVPNEWPPIRLGIWKLETTRILPGGKKERQTRSARGCSEAADIFMGYWGGGTVEKEGCEFHSSKVTNDKFNLDTVCIIRGAPPSRASADVTLNSGDSFDLDGITTEGKKTYRLAQKGRRISDCPDPPKLRGGLHEPR